MFLKAFFEFGLLEEKQEYRLVSGRGLLTPGGETNPIDKKQLENSEKLED